MPARAPNRSRVTACNDCCTASGDALCASAYWAMSGLMYSLRATHRPYRTVSGSADGAEAELHEMFHVGLLRYGALPKEVLHAAHHGLADSGRVARRVLAAEAGQRFVQQLGERLVAGRRPASVVAHPRAVPKNRSRLLG